MDSGSRQVLSRLGKLSRSQKTLVGQVTSLLGASEEVALSLLRTTSWDLNAAVDLFFSQSPPQSRGFPSRAPDSASIESVQTSSLFTPVSAWRKPGRASRASTPGSGEAANPSSPILLEDDTSDGETPETRTQETNFDLSSHTEGQGKANAPAKAPQETGPERGTSSLTQSCEERSAWTAAVDSRQVEWQQEETSRVETRKRGLSATRIRSGKTESEAQEAASDKAAGSDCRDTSHTRSFGERPAAKRTKLGGDSLSWRQSRREQRSTEAEKLLKFLRQKYAWRSQEILQSQNLLSSVGVKTDWTAYVGYLTLDATIITAAFTRPMPSPHMRFVGDVRVQLPATRGPFFLPRKTTPKLYRVDPGFAEIREDAKELFAAKGPTGLGSASGKKRTLPPLTTLVENLTDASCTLRLLLGEREAGRIQKTLSKELLLLLLLDVIKVHVSWVPGAPPAFPLRVGTTVTVAVYVFLTSNLFSLERAKNSVSLDLGGQCSHALATLFQAVRAPLKSRADLLGSSLPSPVASVPSSPGLLTAHRVLDGGVSVPDDENEEKQREEDRPEDEDGESEDEEALDAGNRLSDLVLGTGTFLSSSPLPPAAAFSPSPVNSLASVSSNLGGETPPRGRLCPSRRVFRTTLRRYQEEGLHWLLSRESRDFDFSAAKKKMEKCEHPDQQLAFLPPSWHRLELPSNLPPWLCASPADSNEHRGALSGDRECRRFSEKRPWAGEEAQEARENICSWWQEKNGSRQKATRFLFCNFDVCAFSLSCPTASKAVTGGILGDAMGLGKTVQLLALISTDLLPAYDPRRAHDRYAASRGDPPDSDFDTEEEREGAGATRRQIAGPEAEENTSEEGTSRGRGDTESLLRVASRPAKGDNQRQCSRSSETGDAETLPLAPPPPPDLVAQHLKPDAEGYYPGGTLIVVPLSLLSQWREEIRTHMQPGVCSVYEYYGPGRNKSPAFLASHTLVLTTYQTLATDFRQAGRHQGNAASSLAVKVSGNQSACSVGSGPERADREDHKHAPGGRTFASPLHAIFFYRVVLDEGHIIKSAPSSQSQACCAINAERRWMLTGTPLQNDVSDAFALVKFLKIRPMGTAAWWNAHVAQPMERGQTSVAISTVRSLLLPLMLRRHANSKGEDGNPILPLPPISFHCFNVCLTPFERALYMAFFTRSREEFEKLLKAGVVMTNYSHVLLLLLRLRQLCCHPSLVTARSRDLQERIISGSSEDVDRLLGSLIRRKEMSAAAGETAHASPHFVNSVVQEVREGRVEDCPICLDFPAEPVLLVSCCHTLCHSCAVNLLRRKRNECPICRRKFERNQVKLLPPPALLSAANAEPSKTGSQRSGETAQSAAAGSGEQPSSSSANECEQTGPGKKDEEFFFSTKLKVAIALVAEDVHQGRSCVIFSQWTSMLDMIEKGFAEYERQRNKQGESSQAPLLPYRRLDGSMTSTQRQAVLSWFSHSKNATKDLAFWAEREADDGMGACNSLSAGPEKNHENCGGGPFAGIFQDLRDSKGDRDTGLVATKREIGNGCTLRRQRDDEEGRILLCSLKAGNVGLNLTRASRCYLMDGWWNPQVENQAMKRIWRFGQDKPVKVVRFVCVRTVEERLEEIKEFKGWMARGVCEIGSGVDEVDGQGAPSSGRSESFDEDKQRGRLSIDELKRLFRGFETEELTGAEIRDTRRYPGPALEQFETGEAGSYNIEGSAEPATPSLTERPAAHHSQQELTNALEAADTSMKQSGSPSSSSLQDAPV
uniref:SWI2/SNF2-containing protein RAD5 n=1 Tax=Toxoplasma gondii COUG TaxID=1074873 RepID=A0A2G8XR65_TOXGO|nr:SWI2/SNF2-containing protein RAD5 [Toxoplasma gondii COUG]